MEKVWLWGRNVFALAGVLALGYWLGTGAPVKASSYSVDPASLEFQLTGVNENSSLLVYQPDTKTIYVYQGTTQGNSALQCSFKFQMEKPGEVIRRIPCAVHSLAP